MPKGRRTNNRDKRKRLPPGFDDEKKAKSRGTPVGQTEEEQMTELERLDEALNSDLIGHRVSGGVQSVVMPVVDFKVIHEAARAYRDLLANGERVEPDYMDDWPIVRRLAATQVAKLENHRLDRGLDGWMNEEPHWLLQRLRDEVEELAANPSWEEAADVANFAAMFVDVSRLLVDPPGEEE